MHDKCRLDDILHVVYGDRNLESEALGIDIPSHPPAIHAGDEAGRIQTKKKAATAISSAYPLRPMDVQSITRLLRSGLELRALSVIFFR